MRRPDAVYEETASGALVARIAPRLGAEGGDQRIGEGGGCVVSHDLPPSWLPVPPRGGTGAKLSPGVYRAARRSFRPSARRNVASAARASQASGVRAPPPQSAPPPGAAPPAAPPHAIARPASQPLSARRSARASPSSIVCLCV